MAIIKYSDKEREQLARLMRAEALGEGNLGMLMVGNVILNRAIAACYTFRDINSLTDVIYQNPGGFAGTNSNLYFQRPTATDLRNADRILKGEYFYPATDALWFYAPGDESCAYAFYEQPYAGSYKKHCFYKPIKGVCPRIY